MIAGILQHIYVFSEKVYDYYFMCFWLAHEQDMLLKCMVPLLLQMPPWLVGWLVGWLHR